MSSTKIVKNPEYIKSNLSKFFLEVFDYKVDLSKYSFPSICEDFPAYCFNPQKWNEDQIIEKMIEKWRIKVHVCFSPISKEIARTREQLRPKKPYMFAHTGENNPDLKHRGKSPGIAIDKGIAFANVEEYLYIQAYCKWSTDEFMDKEGWTRTSSYWSDSGMIFGEVLGAENTLLSLDDSYIRIDRTSRAGIREIIF